ncbi:hypothetical protein CMO89_04065 [Candidatus Woesearchaeota archaeon]|nr:hypothetical protein [Candidatus Woesearchaeota archaeon]|tara:strand:+ start:8249 stop:8482 length:234 start_codon:yes stop_codon:yes gene_type:complete
MEISDCCEGPNTSETGKTLKEQLSKAKAAYELNSSTENFTRLANLGMQIHLLEKGKEISSDYHQRKEEPAKLKDFYF